VVLGGNSEAAEMDIQGAFALDVVPGPSCEVSR